MAFQQQINPMDYAKKAGRERRISDVLQDLHLQQAALPGEMDEYKSQKQMLDVGTNVASNVAMKGIIKLLSMSNPLTAAYSGLETAAPLITKLLGMGTKGLGKYSLSNKMSDVFGKQFKIKPPEAPTVDMSKLTGPGMGGARKTIADALEVSDVGYKGGIEDFESGEKLMNLLMSFGPALKESIDIGGKTTTIMDWFRDQLGLSALGKGTGSTVSSVADNYSFNPLKNN